MKNSTLEFIVGIAIAICFFIGGYRAGAETGYNNGFKNGVEIAEEYAKESYTELSYDTEEIYGIHPDAASGILQEYENSGLEHVTNNELINAQYALDHFYDHIWDYLIEICESSLELGEISSN